MTELDLLNRIAVGKGGFSLADGDLYDLRGALHVFEALGYITGVCFHEGRFKRRVILDKVSVIGRLTEKGEARRQELIGAGGA